jgi:hypothetical protein
LDSSQEPRNPTQRTTDVFSLIGFFVCLFSRGSADRTKINLRKTRGKGTKNRSEKKNEKKETKRETRTGGFANAGTEEKSTAAEVGVVTMVGDETL